MDQRPLTKSEEKVVSLLQNFETLVDNKKLSTFLWMSENALEALKRNQVAKPLKVTWDDRQKLFKTSFTIAEFLRYVNFCVKQVGFTIGVDGTITTFDNMVLPNKSKGPV
jgi:hypothetical protein